MVKGQEKFINVCHGNNLIRLVLFYGISNTHTQTRMHARTHTHARTHARMHTHTHTHLFNGPLSGTTPVSQYQKGKTNLDFTEARDSEWHGIISWAICKSAPRSRQITMPVPHHSLFYRPDALLPPNQQRQSTKGNLWNLKMYTWDISNTELTACTKNWITVVKVYQWSRCFWNTV